MITPKNPAAVALGRLGGRAKVPKGAAMISPAEQSRRAKLAWATKRAAKAAPEPPPDLPAPGYAVIDGRTGGVIKTFPDLDGAHLCALKLAKTLGWPQQMEVSDTRGRVPLTLRRYAATPAGKVEAEYCRAEGDHA